jgi:type VI secretion system secreted protein VgrG
MPLLELEVASGELLSVRRFAVREAISEPFEIAVIARAPDPSLNLDAIVGRPATFRMVTGVAGARYPERKWRGICRFAELEQAAPNGLSTYRLQLVPALWLLTQRRDYQIFQHRTTADIVSEVLERWGILPVLSLEPGAHAPLPFKVQYAESDYAFLCRVLEEAGIAFTFPDAEEGDGSPRAVASAAAAGAAGAGRGFGVLALGDRLHEGVPRATPMRHEEHPNEAAEREFVTDVRLHDAIRPGAYTIRDYDLRKPAYRLVGATEQVAGPEGALEHYRYGPGSFLIDTDPSGDTPVADDEGAGRHDEQQGRRRAQRSLEGARADKHVVSFRTNALDLSPGRVFAIDGHPHPALAPARKLLMTALSLEGAPGEEWTVTGKAVFADRPFRPPARTPRPRARVQSATVVGGEEIHPDELGRVRVQFAWDRAGSYTCWVRVSQAWAGAGYGMIMLPRAGHEVLVDFLEGDPEQPVVVGRLFNRMNPPVECLPERDTRSAWKSDSSGGFNEILYDDRKGSEFVYAHVERDGRRLVKNDETSTVVHDRRKDVAGNELETTGHARVQETKGNRVEHTYGDATVATESTLRQLVMGDAIERVEIDRLERVGHDHHLVTHAVKRRRVEQDAHLTIEGRRPESIGGTDSLTVGGALNESVGSYVVQATGPDGYIHLVSSTAIVIESAVSVTVKAGGDFVKTDANVTVVGSDVYINDGGNVPGWAPGPGPHTPETPRVATIDEPASLPDAPPVAPAP